MKLYFNMDCEDIAGKKFSYITWSIHNFSYCWQKTGEPLASPTFYTKRLEETSWKLILYPRGIFNDDYTTVSLFRNSKDFEQEEIEYILQFSDSNDLFLEFCRGKFEHHKGYVRGVILRESLRYLPQDILKLRCKILFTGKTQIIRQIFARTIINIENMSFQWSLEKFSSLETFDIKTFLIESSSKDAIIKIELFETEEEHSDAKIFLSIFPINRCMKYLSVKTFILNSEHNKISSGNFECWFENGKCSTFPLKFTKSDLMTSKNHFLPNDVLTLNFELNISTGFAFEGIEKVVSEYTQVTSNEVIQNWRDYNALEQVSSYPCSLTSDLMSLYEDKSLCDMKLRTKTNIFPVHTSILGARSPVFKAMFSSEMKEKVNGSIDISDLDDETVRRLLLYLYTDEVEDLNWDAALHLFEAADKYSVIPLKEKCSVFLKKHLNLNNACEILIVSDLHQDEDLKVITQNFVLKNAKKILKSEEWKLLVDSYSKLAVETMSRNWIED